MNFVVYIIYSGSLDRYYTGTTDDFGKRFIEHNEGQYSGSFSSRGIPWEEFLVIADLSSGQAYGIEKHIKRMKSRKYIENLKRYPDILKRLRDRYGSQIQPR